MSGPPPRVSVIVPVLDMVGPAEVCARALLQQDHPAERRRLLFVDNGSTDGTPEMLAGLGVEVVREPRRGPAAARNRGLAQTDGEVVAFTDADCVPSSGWLRELVDGLADPAVTVATGSLVALEPWGSAVARYAAAIGQYDPRRTLGHPRFPYAPTGNLAIRRSVFEAVGTFDPRFRTYEGAELFYRVHRAGLLRALVQPKATVFYRTRPTLASFARQNFLYGRDFARFHFEYSGELDTAGVRLPGALGTWRHRVAAGRALPMRLRPVHLLRESALLAGMLAYSPGRAGLGQA